MHRAIKILAFVLVLVFFAGCRTFTDPGDIDRVYVSPDGTSSVHRISWDATRRGTYVIMTTNGPRFISEPPPDAALATLTNIAAKLNTGADGSLGAEGSVDVNETIHALTRAIEISFLRESLYRLGESYVNGAIDSEQYDAHMRDVHTLTSLMVISGQQVGQNPDQLAVLIDAVLQQREAQARIRDNIQMSLGGPEALGSDEERARLEAELDKVNRRIATLDAAEAALRSYE